MSLMELIIRVLKLKRRDLIALIVNTTFIIVFYFLLFENSEILYPLILSGTVIIVYFIIEIIKYCGFKQKLADSTKSPNYKKNNVDYKEEEILNVIDEIHNEYLNEIYELKEKIKGKDYLFSQWIHNMKTSITVIDLACEKSELENKEIKYIKDIKEENSSIKKNLEECLNLLRLEDFSRDYVTNPYNLKELVSNAINLKKRDFIYKGVFPKVNISENIYIYTDKKWFLYMLEQIIANAIKYSKIKNSSRIEIYAKEDAREVELIVKDYGVGINKEDLPRIFNPFFTGNNGRQERSSTGIGLYMVKLISKKLGILVDIQSDVGKGTKVSIKFKDEKVI
ncbi:sensor histidine kinase [Clostridium sp. ATCC 25772]|uniref:sensor histidine kinase n=1 Tax=Clostridium sp. ATCC 25772 TaxID=1676991 RepID=UPI000784D355|nr:sensor histidine kinase [Clostridium sp. ATCC 25772]